MLFLFCFFGKVKNTGNLQKNTESGGQEGKNGKMQENPKRNLQIADLIILLLHDISKGNYFLLHNFFLACVDFT